MKHLFYKGKVDRRNAKAMYEFLKNHFTYYTMNSWNGLVSIANKVKLYDLQLEGDKWLALGLLQMNAYSEVTAMIEQFQDEYPLVNVYFNGRSGGYMVLTADKMHTNIIPSWILADDYEEFKQNCIDYYGSIAEARYELIGYVELVEDFDKLCDRIRDYVNKLSLKNRDTLISNELNELVDQFNEYYADDLAKMDLNKLKVEKDAKGLYINVAGIETSKSLKTCFDSLLDRYADAITIYRANKSDSKVRLVIE